jgi:predicted nuclease with TOPRIM domain
MTPEQIAEKRREAIEANETGETFSRRDIIDLCDALAERDAEIERLQQVVGQVSMFNQMNNDLENECGELSTRVAELEEKNEQMKSELFQAARAK